MRLLSAEREANAVANQELIAVLQTAPVKCSIIIN